MEQPVHDTANSLPTLFIPHGGGPCFFMDWNPPDTWNSMAEFLKGISASVGARPKAILVISGHWEQGHVAVTGSAEPSLIYDYSGFPVHTYELKYDAPGSPELARRIDELLNAGNVPVHIDPQRGFDHGVFIPFKLIYPQAEIPIVQMSLQRRLDPAQHVELGRLLAPLRNEGVLIVGSGMSYHNLHGFGDEFRAASDEFDAWLTDAVTDSDPESRSRKLIEWQNAPHARLAHPREEHLLPLMVATGAAAGDRGKRTFSDYVMGVRVSAYQFG